MSLAINDTALKNSILAAGAAKNYPEMYRLVAAGMKDGRIPGASSDQIYWFEQAAKINAGDTSSPASVFIRAATVAGLTASGKRTDEAYIQDISNDIGRKVAFDIGRDGNRGQIPIKSWIPDQVGDDAGVAVMTPVCPA